MKLLKLIRKREVATVTVATLATVTPINTPSVATVASVNVATEAGGTPETLINRQREARRQKIIAMLEAAPGKRYAVLVEDASTDPVVVAAGIQKIATFEMEIPQKYYDGMALLELIEKHSGEKHANT